MSAAMLGGALAGCAAGADQAHESSGSGNVEQFEIVKTEEEWRQQLTPQQFQILRKHGTERAGSSPLNQEKRDGTFVCAACGLRLFSSETKYDSGTGWPSFTAPLDDAVGTSVDRRLFMTRIEVHCRRCGGHLGHVFDDGPGPTGKRYCMNGAAMEFEPASEGSRE
jgi:peptide-methionine (R)-S-oxide reductase